VPHDRRITEEVQAGRERRGAELDHEEQERVHDPDERHDSDPDRHQRFDHPAGRDRESDRYLGHGESEPDGRE
jgi:hypothetical protein